MDRKIRISVYSFDLPAHACAQLRLLLPMALLKDRVELSWEVKNDGKRYAVAPGASRDADLIIVQRSFPDEETRPVMEEIFSSGKPVVYEADDLFTDMPPAHPLKAKAGSFQKQVLRTLEQADCVTVSTPYLKDAFSEWNQRITVLPNFLHEGVWRTLPSDRGGPVVIGFAGTPTHEADLRLVEEPLARIAEKYGEGVRFRFFGCGTARLKRIPSALPVPFDADYISYARRLPRLGLDLAWHPWRTTPSTGPRATSSGWNIPWRARPESIRTWSPTPGPWSGASPACWFPGTGRSGSRHWTNWWPTAPKGRPWPGPHGSGCWPITAWPGARNNFTNAGKGRWTGGSPASGRIAHGPSIRSGSRGEIRPRPPAGLSRIPAGPRSLPGDRGGAWRGRAQSLRPCGVHQRGAPGRQRGVLSPEPGGHVRGLRGNRPLGHGGFHPRAGPQSGLRGLLPCDRALRRPHRRVPGMEPGASAGRHGLHDLSKRDALEADKTRPVSTVAEIVAAHTDTEAASRIRQEADGGEQGHCFVYTLSLMLDVIVYANHKFGLCWKVVDSQETDDKVGNGHVVVARYCPPGYAGEGCRG